MRRGTGRRGEGEREDLATERDLSGGRDDTRIVDGELSTIDIQIVLMT